MGLPDRSTLGPSRDVPFDPNEHYKDRHDRRKAIALANEIEAGIAFAMTGGWLRVTNDGHHWSIYFADKMLAEWWPSSAKLVIDKQWGKSIHAHDWKQVLSFIQNKRPA